VINCICHKAMHLVCVCVGVGVCISVVVSQWTSMLNIVEIHLNRAGISFSRIDGT